VATANKKVRQARTFGLLAMSTSGHIICFAMLGLVPSPSEVLAMGPTEIEIVEPEPEEEPPPPPEEPEPDPEPEPEPEPRRAAQKAEPEPEPEPAESPEPVDEVADFTGETLTVEGAGGGWSTVVGSGAPLKGPVGKIGRKMGQKDLTPSAKAARGPKVVPAKSLARSPRPPGGLDAALIRNYPSKARTQGIEGTVVLAIRILPDGRPGSMTVSRETPSGYDFGQACKRTIREKGRWAPPLANGGQAVATDVKFTCSFTVDY